jgi:hypothetical protein
MPKSSVVPPASAGNWATTLAFSNSTAETKNAVGRSSTMASIWFGVEGGLGCGVVVVDERLLARLDHVGDEVEARGADLCAELDVGEVGERRCALCGEPSSATIAWLLE